MFDAAQGDPPSQASGSGLEGAYTELCCVVFEHGGVPVPNSLRIQVWHNDAWVETMSKPVAREDNSRCWVHEGPNDDGEWVSDLETIPLQLDRAFHDWVAYLADSIPQGYRPGVSLEVEQLLW